MSISLVRVSGTGISARQVFLVVLVCITLVRGACAQAVLADDGPPAMPRHNNSLKIVTTESLAPLGLAVAKRFAELRWDVAAGDRDLGIQKVRAGLAAVALTDQLPAEANDQQPDVVAVPFAWEAVAVVVHPSSAVVALRTQQIRDVFSGRITRWRPIGGPDLPIHVYSWGTPSSTREIFRTMLLQRGPVVLAARPVTSSKQMREMLLSDPQGIGYLRLGLVGRELRAVALDGVPPTAVTVRSGTYKTAQRLYLVTRGKPVGQAKTFVDFLLGEGGVEEVEAAGLIPLTVKAPESDESN